MHEIYDVSDSMTSMAYLWLGPLCLNWDLSLAVTVSELRAIVFVSL